MHEQDRIVVKAVANGMRHPLVSIISPCFNGARYLAGLAANLALITKEAVEIIFVDDGSTDASAEMFVKLVPDVIVVKQGNAGVAAARNAGARAAGGDFVQLLDVDDVILPGKLQVQSGFAQEKGLDVVYSGWQMVVVDGARVTRELLVDYPMPGDPVAALLGGWWVPPHAYLIRRSAYWEVGGSDESLVNAQDFDLVLRLAIAGKKFGHFPGHFADYYRYLDRGSLARGPRRQYWVDYDKSVSKAVSLLETTGQFTSERRKAAARKLHSVARSVYAIDRSWFRDVVRRIREIDPRFTPEGPPAYRTIARLFGLAFAEWLASAARSLRVRRN